MASYDKQATDTVREKKIKQIAQSIKRNLSVPNWVNPPTKSKVIAHSIKSESPKSIKRNKSKLPDKSSTVDQDITFLFIKPVAETSFVDDKHDYYTADKVIVSSMCCVNF